MDYFAGLDVSVKDTSVCIVDDTGGIVREVKVASEPAALLAVLKNDPLVEPSVRPPVVVAKTHNREKGTKRRLALAFQPAPTSPRARLVSQSWASFYSCSRMRRASCSQVFAICSCITRSLVCCVR
jgi:hypothetical protein